MEWKSLEYVWSKQNMKKKKIVGMVGDIVCLDMKTELGYSMDSTKVLVHTVHMPFIDRGITFIYLLKV